MSATIEYIEDVEQANFLLNKCLNTIDELNNRVDEEKARTQKYRETNTKLRKSNIDLRDYFAAKAMQAIIGNSDQASVEVSEVDNWVGDYAYVVADAMMEAKERK
jgi:23S rRNA maturation mini-RNase III